MQSDHPLPWSRRAVLIPPLVAALALAVGLWPPPAAAGIGSANSAEESRSVAEFQAVAVAGSIDLVLRQGAQAVRVQAADHLLPLLETLVESGSRGATLQVRWKKGASLRPRSTAVVTVTVPRLTSLAGSGGGDIRLEPFNTPALRIALAGSGDVRIDRLATEELDIQLAGSSDVAGSGRATRLLVAIAGSGHVGLADLQADEVSIRIAGSGDAAVDARKSLAVSIMGSGDVSYRGHPALQTTVAGSGTVRKH